MPDTSDQEPPKRTVQMYDRPASADRPPLGRVIVAVLLLAACLLVGLLAARFIFHIHLGHLLHAALPSHIATAGVPLSWRELLELDMRSSQW